MITIQPRPFAPALAAGGLVAAISAGLLGSWRIIDCVRFQARAGQCDEAIDRNIGSVVAAVGAVGAAFGAWNTLNPNLRASAPADPLPLPHIGLMPYRKPEEQDDE